MIEKITLDMLNVDSVSVRKTRETEEGDKIGQPHRKAYVNSEQGRLEVESELLESHRNAIFSVWGNEPTVFLEVEQ